MYVQNRHANVYTSLNNTPISRDTAFDNDGFGLYFMTPSDVRFILPASSMYGGS